VFDRSSEKVLGFITTYKLYKDEDEERSSKGANTVDFIIYVEKISRYVEREYIGRFGSKNIGI